MKNRHSGQFQAALTTALSSQSQIAGGWVVLSLAGKSDEVVTMTRKKVLGYSLVFLLVTATAVKQSQLRA